MFVFCKTVDKLKVAGGGIFIQSVFTERYLNPIALQQRAVKPVDQPTWPPPAIDLLEELLHMSFLEKSVRFPNYHFHFSFSFNSCLIISKCFLPQSLMPSAERCSR